MKYFICFLFIVLTGCNDIESSKESGISYVENKPVEQPVSILLDYINRTYSAKINYSLKKIENKSEKNDTDLFVRLSDPDKTITQEEINSVHYAIDGLTISALYCDKFELKDDFFKTIDKYVAINGYTLTHSGIALSWATENGCLNSEQQKIYSEKIMTRLREYIEQADYFHDKVFTAVAVLAYMGGGAEIKKEWINKVIACQNDNGSWPSSCKSKQRVSDYATAFSLWAIFAYENKNIQKNWIRHKQPSLSKKVLTTDSQHSSYD